MSLQTHGTQPNPASAEIDSAKAELYVTLRCGKKVAFERKKIDDALERCALKV
jgi:hypothetical protein